MRHHHRTNRNRTRRACLPYHTQGPHRQRRNSPHKGGSHPPAIGTRAPGDNRRRFLRTHPLRIPCRHRRLPGHRSHPRQTSEHRDRTDPSPDRRLQRLPTLPPHRRCTDPRFPVRRPHPRSESLELLTRRPPAVTSPFRSRPQAQPAEWVDPVRVLLRSRHPPSVSHQACPSPTQPTLLDRNRTGTRWSTRRPPVRQRIATLCSASTVPSPWSTAALRPQARSA